MTDVLIQAGTLTASRDERTVTGLLLPYNEQGASNLGKFAIAPGAVAIPADPSVVGLNLGHDREQPVGRATALASTDAGITATFSIAKTPEGDTLLADIAEGRMARLSAEVKNIVLRGGQAIAGSLFGAAAVERGAFPSAALLAQAPDTEGSSHWEDTYTDENGVTWRRVEDTQTTTEQTETGSKTQTVTTVETETTEPTDGEDQEETTMTAQQAVAPSTLAPTAPAEKVLDKHTLFAAIANAHRTGDTSGLREFERASHMSMYAALKDVTEAGNAAVLAPQFVGELWRGTAYARRFAPLLNSAELTSSKVKGWRWVQKPTVAAYAGNKTDVPSNQPTTEAVEFESTRIAGAHDIDRRFRDFGDTSFLDSYFAAMTESYAQVSDLKVLADIDAAATVMAPGTVPSGIPAGLAYLVDGALRVIDNTNQSPDFAIVSAALYRAIVLSPKDSTFEFLSAATGLTEGNLAGFRILPSTQIAANSVIVGVKNAATVHELGGGSPIRVEGLDVARGGIDPGVFGYIGTVIHDKSALVKVRPAP